MDKRKLQEIARWVGVIIAVVLAVFSFLGVEVPIPGKDDTFEAEGVHYGQYGNARFDGAVMIESSLDVDGTANLDDMDIDLSGEFEIDGALVDIGGGSGGTADGDNDLLVAGDLEVDDTVDVDGDIDLNGDGFDVDITAGFSVDGDAASNVTVAGAGIDLTLESEAGRVVIKGDEAAADGIYIDANDAAGTGASIVVGSSAGLSIDGGLTDFGGGTYATANGDNDVGIDGDLEVNGSSILDGLVDVGGLLLFSFADETITDGEVLTPTVTVYSLDTSGAVTMTLAASASEGQLLILINDDANGVTVNDTNLASSDGNAVVLTNADDVAVFIYQDSVWHELLLITNS